MLMYFPDRFARAAIRRQQTDVKVRVPGEQPQQLTARISTRAGHRDPHPHRPSARFQPCCNHALTQDLYSATSQFAARTPTRLRLQRSLPQPSPEE
jgi:hypothetical protein